METNKTPDYTHYTVMKKEVCDMLNCKASNKIYVDCTLGGGGHSEEILKRISPEGRLIAFDVDEDAISAASKRLEGCKNLTIINSSYANIEDELLKIGIEKITGGVVFDLGASYHQLTSAERGFSFLKDAPLDMRFNKEQDFCAGDIVNKYKEQELVEIFSKYGEERFSKRIARAIVEYRKKKAIKTTKELADLIKQSTPFVKSKLHPATRVFQALRIEVNNELLNFEKTLNKVITMSDVDAIICVLSFHSLEDRIAKQVFKRFASPDIGLLELINKKPLQADDSEIKINPPSRSAKLRGARKKKN